MARIFIYDGKEIPDLDPTMSVEEVRQFLANSFPELFNAETDKKKRGDDEVYTFRKRVGTKGASVFGKRSDLSICNVGVVGQKTHLRHKQVSGWSLCNRLMATPNRGDDGLPLDSVECRVCKSELEKHFK